MTMVGPARRSPDEFATINDLIAALYDVISGPAGVEPDWQRERQLFAPGARLLPSRRMESGQVVFEPLSVEEFIVSRGAYLRENAFYERQVASKIDQFGHIAHVFSTYESSETPDGAPFARGINSIQLIQRDGRWWVHSIMWTSESGDLQVPEEYLP